VPLWLRGAGPAGTLRERAVSVEILSETNQTFLPKPVPILTALEELPSIRDAYDHGNPANRLPNYVSGMGPAPDRRAWATTTPSSSFLFFNIVA